MTWFDVIEYERLPIDRGVAAMVGSRPVAIFRLADGTVHAIDHVDPFTGVGVLARGLVGSCGTAPTVASPLHKQRFDLRTGECLDGDGAVSCFPVEVRGGMVQVSSTPVGATSHTSHLAS